jgi:hypothetical protein
MNISTTITYYSGIKHLNNAGKISWLNFNFTLLLDYNLRDYAAIAKNVIPYPPPPRGDTRPTVTPSFSL